MKIDFSSPFPSSTHYQHNLCLTGDSNVLINSPPLPISPLEASFRFSVGLGTTSSACFVSKFFTAFFRDSHSSVSRF